MKKQTILQTARMLSLVVAGLSLVLPIAAHAATSDWAVAKGGRMRLVALPAREDGSIPAILQIELEKGWKTYWREPGSSGIPPHVILADGGNAILSGIRFPVPTIFEDGKIRDYVYDTAVSLVLDVKQLSADLPSHLDTQVFIGLCETICVPFQANLSVSVDKSNPAQGAEAALIAQADMTLPEPPSDDFKINSAKLSPDGKAVSVTLTLPNEKAANSPRVLLTNPDGLTFEQTELKTNADRTLSTSFKLRSASASYSLADKQVQILVLSGGRSMETTLAFEQ